jgi:hypothetical protein
MSTSPYLANVAELAEREQLVSDGSDQAEGQDASPKRTSRSDGHLVSARARATERAMTSSTQARGVKSDVERPKGVATVTLDEASHPDQRRRGSRQLAWLYPRAVLWEGKPSTPATPMCDRRKRQAEGHDAPPKESVVLATVGQLDARLRPTEGAITSSTQGRGARTLMLSKLISSYRLLI